MTPYAYTVSLQLYQLHNSKFNFTCSCMLCSQTTVLNSQSCIPHSHRFHCCDFTSSHSHRKLHTAQSQISLLWLYKFTQSHKVAYCTVTDFTVVTLQVHTVTESCIQCSHIFHQCNSTMWQRFHNSNSTKLHRLHDSNFIKLHPAQSYFIILTPHSFTGSIIPTQKGCTGFMILTSQTCLQCSHILHHSYFTKLRTLHHSDFTKIAQATSKSTKLHRLHILTSPSCTSRIICTCFIILTPPSFLLQKVAYSAVTDLSIFQPLKLALILHSCSHTKSL